MNRDDVHRCWAPDDGRWSAWVKPVLFANLDEVVEPQPLAQAPDWLRTAVIEPLSADAPAAAPAHPYRGDLPLRDTAIVVDLPGPASARLGVAFVEWGFRPDAVPAFLAVIDLRPLMEALVNGAERVAQAPRGGPPVFLLDANRTSGSQLVKPGVFDNRSVCRVSDFPSADALWQAGIRRALLIQSSGDRPAIDLEAVLATWQERGIALWKKSAAEATAAAPFLLKRRWWLSRLLHLVGRSFLPRRPDDAFGMMVPEPSAG